MKWLATGDGVLLLIFVANNSDTDARVLLQHDRIFRHMD